METEVKKKSIKDATIEVTPHAREYLHGASGWAKFLSILMFIMIALMVLGAIFAGSIFSSAATTATQMGPQYPHRLATTMTVTYLIMAVIYLFPAIYLYRFAVNTRKALELSDSDIMREAFRYQKRFFKFIGILYIVLLLFAVIGGITALIAGASGCKWMM